MTRFSAQFATLNPSIATIMGRGRDHKDHCKVAVSTTDRWLGNCIARCLLMDCKKRNVTIRCLAQNTDSRHVKKLEHLGGEIHKINYDRSESIEDALHGCDYLVFVSEIDRDRVKKAKILADASRKADCLNSIVMSIEGVDKGHGELFVEFREIEKIFEDRIKNNFANLFL
nr:9879_t:CDS:2 [Entrophospora candida]